VPFFVYAATNNGWGYTWNPLFSMVFILTGFLYLEYSFIAKKQNNKNAQSGKIACISSLIANAIYCFICSLYLVLYSCGMNFDCPNGKKFIERIIAANDGKPLKSFGTIAMDFNIWTELRRETKANWDTRFSNIFMLPKFFISDENFQQKNQWILDYVDNAYYEDLTNNKPEIVFVDDVESFYSVKKKVDLIDYMSKMPKFKEAWKNYKYIDRICLPNECNDKEKQVYTILVYKRIQE
jgi:hypothetical protein